MLVGDVVVTMTGFPGVVSDLFVGEVTVVLELEVTDVFDLEAVEVVVTWLLLVVEIVGLKVGTDNEDDEEDEVESLNDRYQFFRSVSPRHSPTVTPFHFLALMRSK